MKNKDNNTHSAINKLEGAMLVSQNLHDKIVDVEKDVFDDLQLIKYPDNVSAHEYLKKAEKFCSIHQDLSDAIFALNLTIANLQHAQDVLAGHILYDGEENN